MIVNIKNEISLIEIYFSFMYNIYIFRNYGGTLYA